MSEASQPDKLMVRTSRFGEIAVEPGKVVTMPHGMIGFPNDRRFILLHHGGNSPFHWLQSLDREDLAFVTVSPLLFDPQYEIALGNSDTNLLQVEDPKDIQVWVVVTIPHGQPEHMTGNLKAPVVINLKNRLGSQVIMDNPKYEVRQGLTSFL